MATKKTETKVKTTTKKKKIKSPTAKAIDDIYNSVLTGNFQVNPERIATAQALVILRSIELRKNDELGTSLWIAYQECREPVLRSMLTAILKNGLRLIDAQIMMDMIKNEVAMLSAWEYEHLDEADEIIKHMEDKKYGIKTSKTLELFKAIGSAKIKEEEDDE